jgi:hypothetical protein
MRQPELAITSAMLCPGVQERHIAADTASHRILTVAARTAQQQADLSVCLLNPPTCLWLANSAEAV